MTNEKWMPIKGYEGLYDVSNNGNVRRMRKTNSGDVGSYLQPVKDKLGYERVCLCKNGKEQKYYVHRLVADAFVEGNGRDVNHINGNKSDNNAENLEWCSHKENMIKAAETGLIKSKPVLQTQNGKKIAEFSSLAEASKKTGINKSNIAKCCLGKRKTANGYEWSWGESLPYFRELCVGGDA